MSPTRRKSSAHPLSGTTLPGSDIIVQVLADEGVDTVFGYSGGAILPTYDAIFRYNEQHRTANHADPMKLIVPANEQGAGFMAAGYARATGRVGVFLVTSGPGATNAVTPIRDCMADSIPVVMISGQVPTSAIGTDAFQEAPIFNIMSSCAKQVYMVTDPEQLEATVRTAFEIARTGRPGPVVIDVPKDVQNWEGPYDGKVMLDIGRYRKRIEHLKNRAVPVREGRRLLKAIQRAKRPLIYAGGGVVAAGASAELTRFAETFQVPVVTTLMGIGAIDTTHPLCLRMLGMHGTAYANYAVEDCDLLLAVGARFDDRVAGNAAEFAPNARFLAHIDIDEAEIGKVKTVDWHHVGDARTALDSLLALQKEEQIVSNDHAAWIRQVAKMREQYPMGYDRDSDAIQPQYVLEELNRLTKGEAIVSTGVGQHQMWAAQFLDFREPRLWLTSGSMGTMGFGLPAAIGAWFGRPDHIVVDVDGDGSIRMNLGELETATTYGVPVKILLLNNEGDGMVRQWQRLFFGNRFSGSDKSLHSKDFVLAAEADRFTFAQRVERKADVPKALQAWLDHDGPAFLDVRIDRDASVFPMVPPGKSYRDMITGDFIPSRTPVSETETEAADLF
ncbi:MAG: biosynthetic-type acetolactate synthase large subunit [Candidatus Dadabacteria bacterium]|nr:MAG: biosynthetic-type acetolactate synthase large subunit [Candidatus Dadabacteria bacterium]